MESSSDPLQTIKKLKEAKTLPNSVLLLAPDATRRNRVAAMLFEVAAQQRAKNESSSPQIKRFNAGDLNSNEITKLADELLSLSLFATTQLFLIENIEALSAALLRELQDVIEKASVGVFVVVTGSTLPSNSVFLKFFKKADTLIQFEELKGYELQRWIQKELKSLGVKEFGDNEVTAIATMCDGSIDAAAQMLQHLALYLDGAPLTLAEIQKLFTHQPNPSDYELIDAINSCNRVRVETLIKQLLENGKSPFLLVAMLGRTWSQYLSLKFLAGQRRSPGDVRQALNIPPWLLQKQMAAVKKYPLPHLVRGSHAIVRSDSMLKNRSLGADAILSELASNLMYEAAVQ